MDGTLPDHASREPPLRARAMPWLVSGRGVAVAILALIATFVVFRLDPDLDLAGAGLFYAGENRFIGSMPAGEAARRIFYYIPVGIVFVMVALRLLKQVRATSLWAPDWRGVVFLLVSLIVGPGLLVNMVLKDHSHRPRPVQTEAFGGALPFRPIGSFDGACAKNCSFVSGEGAASFWTVAPALLVPAAMQPVALTAALCFGVAASLLRMAFGGHYLSDTIAAALLVWLVIAASWWTVVRRSTEQRS